MLETRKINCTMILFPFLHIKMPDEVEFLGKKLVKTLRDVLYIDVHLLREPYQLQSSSNRSVIIMYHNYQSIVEDKL